MESSDKGGDGFYFRDVGNRIPHLGKSPDVTTEELGRFLINVIQIVLGARPSTRSHIVLVKTFFSCSQDPMESRARLVNQFIAVGLSMTGR